MDNEVTICDGQNLNQENPTKQEFSPGSIHNIEFRDFWKTELAASDWVMETLTNGYVIPFESFPPIYEEPNNASAVQDPAFVNKAINDLKRLGIIVFTDVKPHCVSPLTVSLKTGKDGLIKKRLCWDGSRCVNNYLQKQKVTLSHLQRALEITKSQDFQIIYDLKAAYHHIKIHSSHTKYLGASFKKPDGGDQYFFFLYIPFGLATAVHCITKLFKPINAYLHEKGVRHTIYLDDGRIVAETKVKAEEQRVLVYGVLEKAGWFIEIEKSDKKGDADRSKEYLGFIVDTITMSVRLNEIKKRHILQQVTATIEYGSNPIAAKELAGTLGKIVATEPALGPVVIMASRAAYLDLNAAVARRGWGTKLSMSKEALEGLRFFAENCSKFDNSPIRSAATEISVLSIIGPPDSFMKTSFVANHIRTVEEKIWASDASGYATCAYSIKGEHLYFRGMLNNAERELSSGHRELIAVTRTLEHYERTGAIPSKATNVYWLTDSQNMTTFLTKGSSKGPIQKEVFQIMTLCKGLNIRIIPIHLLRDDPRIQIADDGSKTVDSDDWQIDHETFQRINQKYNFSLDLFASNRNKQCKKFFSNFYCPGTHGIDAYSHAWEGEVLWICPPVKEVTKIVRRLKASKVIGVLFIPEWRTSDYWTEVFDSQGNLSWPFEHVSTCRPFIIQGTHNYRSPFAGRVKFNFLTISFNSTTQ